MGSNSAHKLNVQSDAVRDAVARSQHRRHLLIFSIQIFFAINILLVVKAAGAVTWRGLASGPEMPLFSCYAAFSLWCLYRSAQGRLRWYDVTLSIVLDYALYMAVLFSRKGHVLGADAGLHAAPLFSYVYLFIAMRSLHFSPAYVQLAGALASLAWTTMLLTTAAGHGGSIDAYFSQLSFDEAMLSGAIDKLLSIFAVTFVLAICARESRRHLVNAVVRGMAGTGLAKMVGAGVAKEVIFGGHTAVPGRGRKQKVAILMIDIRNFSKFAAQSDPADVIALLARYHRLIEPLIVRYGGSIDKYMGDGILAHFGAMNAKLGFVSQSLQCVEHILYETDRWNRKRKAAGEPALHFRVACVAGHAVVGLVGSRSKVEFTVIGDPVNVTAKLEKYAKALKARAVTTAETFQLAREQGFVARFPVSFIAKAQVPGIDQALDLVVMANVPAHEQGATNSSFPAHESTVSKSKKAS